MCIYFYTLVNKFNICFLFFLAVQIYMIFFEKTICPDGTASLFDVKEHGFLECVVKIVVFYYFCVD